MKLAKQDRILGIAPATKGFGFALIKADGTLVDWGFRQIKGDDKNEASLKAIGGMIDHCAPNVIVIHDYESKNSGRSERVRKLGREIIALAKSHNVNMVQLTRDQIKAAFFPCGTGTKYSVAQSLAARFPNELGWRLPPKRKAWKNEDNRMNIFDAVALGWFVVEKKYLNQ